MMRGGLELLLKEGGTGKLLLFMKGTWYISMNTKFEVSRLYLPWFHEIIFRLKIEETTAPRDASGRSRMLIFF